MKIPIVETQMLIRRPARDVYKAFIDPTITTNFWFTKSSGRLEEGKQVTWEWEVYGVKDLVTVKKLIPGEFIQIEWSDPPTIVDFEFKPLTAETTYVVIKNYGFHQTSEELITILKDLTGGFTTVLEGAKAWLEFNIRLNLIAYKFPKEVSDHGA